jgi:hypothetical protein
MRTAVSLLVEEVIEEEEGVEVELAAAMAALAWRWWRRRRACVGAGAGGAITKADVEARGGRGPVSGVRPRERKVVCASGAVYLV